MKKYIALLFMLLFFVSPARADISIGQVQTFTLGVMGDTQKILYGWGVDPALTDYLFTGQVAWINAKATDLDLQGVIHVGDWVETSKEDDSDLATAEHASFKDKMIELNVPYFLAVGNHDIDEYFYYPDDDGAEDDDNESHTTRGEHLANVNTYFPISYFEGKSWWGGYFDDTITNSIANAYYFFDWGEYNFIVLCLEFWPRDAAIAWANEICVSYPNHNIIINTHGYLMNTGQFSYVDHDQYHPNQGQGIWDNLINLNENIVLVTCGHHLADPSVFQTRTRTSGSKVAELFINYQGEYPYGLPQDSLSILAFKPSTGMIRCNMYSPVNYGVDFRWNTTLTGITFR